MKKLLLFTSLLSLSVGVMSAYKGYSVKNNTDKSVVVATGPHGSTEGQQITPENENLPQEVHIIHAGKTQNFRGELSEFIKHTAIYFVGLLQNNNEAENNIKAVVEPGDGDLFVISKSREPGVGFNAVQMKKQ